MQNGYYNAVGAMVTSFNRLDVVTNNLANVNTQGYKQDDLVIGDYMRLLDEKRKIMPLENNSKEGAKFLNRSLDRVPQVVEQWTDFSIGNLKQTGNSLDMALTKDNLFFTIKDNLGNQLLSKKGSFAINENSLLVEKSSGYIILGNEGKPITLKSGRTTVDIEGNIYNDNKKINKLQIQEVSNLKYLEKKSSSSFKVLKDDILSVAQNVDSLRQGFLEGSNVNPIIAMTSLIAVNRSIEFAQKAMTTQMDDMNNDAINKIAVVKN